MQTAAEGGNFHSKIYLSGFIGRVQFKSKKAHARGGFSGFIKKVALAVAELWMRVTLVKFVRGLGNHIILTFEPDATD